MLVTVNASLVSDGWVSERRTDRPLQYTRWTHPDYPTVFVDLWEDGKWRMGDVRLQGEWIAHGLFAELELVANLHDALTGYEG